jgi:replicative DNA helicase
MDRNASYASVDDAYRPYPHSPQAEAAILGSLMIDPDSIAHARTRLPTTAFYIVAHRIIYEAILSLYKRKMDVDIVTVLSELKSTGRIEEVGGDGFVANLLTVPETPYHLESYVQIVYENWVRRKLIVAAGQLATIAWDGSGEETFSGALHHARQSLASIDLSTERNPVRDATEVADDYMADFEEDLKGPPAHSVISTGFPDLNRLINGGFTKPYAYFFGARQGQGKSALALTFAIEALRHDYRVLFLSLEMTEAQILGRMVSQITKLPYSSIVRENRHLLTPAQVERVRSAMALIRQSPFKVDETPALSPGQVDVRLDRLAAAGEGVDLVIFDHMFIASPDKSVGNPEKDMGVIAQRLSDICKGYNTAAVILHQFKMGIADRTDYKPKPEDFYGGTGVHGAAYFMAGLVRPHAFDDLRDENEAFLSIVKSRDGKADGYTISLNWDGPTMRFTNGIRNYSP